MRRRVQISTRRMKPLVFTHHALTQFRDRWSDARRYSDAQLMQTLTERIDDARRSGRVVDTPSGRYFPFCFYGEDGFAVIVGEQQVVTVMPAAWCKEVNEQLNEYG